MVDGSDTYEDVGARVTEAWREAARRAWRREQLEREQPDPWWGPNWSMTFIPKESR